MVLANALGFTHSTLGAQGSHDARYGAQRPECGEVGIGWNPDPLARTNLVLARQHRQAGDLTLVRLFWVRNPFLLASKGNQEKTSAILRVSPSGVGLSNDQRQAG